MAKKRRTRAGVAKKRRNRSSSFDWRRLAFRIQIIFALVVPFVFIKGLYNYIELPRGALIQLAALLLLLLWLMGATSQDGLRIMRTPLDLPLLGLLFWAGLSLLWAPNFYVGFEIWVQWSACLVFFFLTVNLVQSERAVGQLLGALLLAGTLVAVLGICQYLLEVKWVPQIVPPAATFANRNMAAPFMVMTLPVAAAFFLLSRKRIHVLLSVIALGIVSLFLFYGSTRSAWLAVAVEFLFLTILLARDHFRWKRTSLMGAQKKKALLLCAVVVFIFINLTPSGFQWRVGAAVDRIHEVLPRFGSPPLPASNDAAQVSAEDPSQAQLVQATASTGDSLSVRIRLWRNTLRMGAEHFIRGVGVGNFRVVYPRYTRSAVVDGVFSERGQWGRAHNDYLQTFSELGMVGLFFLGWLLFALIKACVALLGEKPAGELRHLVRAVMIALLGLSVSAFFSFPFQMVTPTFIFAIYLGVLGGHYSRELLQNENSVASPKVSIVLPSWAATAGAGVTFLLLLILIPVQYNRLKADWYYQRTKIASDRKVWAAVISQAREGYRYNPYRKDFLFELGRAYFETGDEDAAIEATEEHLESYPYYVNGHHNAAVAYVRKGDLDRAYQHFDQVLEILPGHGKAHFVLAQLHERKNELDKALEHYRLAVEGEGDNAEFWGRLGNVALRKKLFSEGKEAFEEAVRNDPENSGYYVKLGIVAANLEELKEAGIAFAKAVELAPESGEAHFRLGMILFLVFERQEEGIQHLKEALNLGLLDAYSAEAKRTIEEYRSSILPGEG